MTFFELNMPLRNRTDISDDLKRTIVSSVQSGILPTVEANWCICWGHFRNNEGKKY